MSNQRNYQTEAAIIKRWLIRDSLKGRSPFFYKLSVLDCHPCESRGLPGVDSRFRGNDKRHME